MSRRWIFIGCITAGLVLTGFGVWGAVANLDAADKVASVVGGVVGVLSLAYGVVQARHGPASGGQSVADATVYGGVNQVKNVQGNVRIGPAGTTTPPTATPAPPPIPPTPALADSSAPEGQSVTRSHVTGPIYQIDDVGGNVDVDR